MQLRRHDVPFGLSGTEATLRLMFELIEEGQVDPPLMDFTDAAVGQVPAKAEKALIRRTAAAWNRRVVVREDPVRHEFLRSPTETLRRGAGDCDDLAIGMGASLEYLGFPISLVVVSDNPAGAQSFSHVYLRAWLSNGEWFPVDLRSMQEFGWPAGVEIRAQDVTAERAYAWEEGSLIQVASRNVDNRRMGAVDADPFRDVDRGSITGEFGTESGLSPLEEEIVKMQERDRKLSRAVMWASLATAGIALFSFLRGKK